MKKIDELTPADLHLMDEIVHEYEELALGGDDSVNLEVVREGFDFLYGLVPLPPPREVILCASPNDLREKTIPHGGRFDGIGLGYDSGWTAFYDFFERLGIEYPDDSGWSRWKKFLKNGGVFETVLFENAAFFCPRPASVHRLPDGRLHNPRGPAITWSRDGFQLFFLNGVRVPEAVVMTPAEKLDPAIALHETNAEVRREIVRKIGIERLVLKLGARTLDRKGDYELLSFSLGGDRERPYLKMRNPSLGVFHIEGVPPGVSTVEEALTWRKPEALAAVPIDDINGEDWFIQGDVQIWPQNPRSLKRYPKIIT